MPKSKTFHFEAMAQVKSACPTFSDLLYLQISTGGYEAAPVKIAAGTQIPLETFPGCPDLGGAYK